MEVMMSKTTKTTICLRVPVYLYEERENRAIKIVFGTVEAAQKIARRIHRIHFLDDLVHESKHKWLHEYLWGYVGNGFMVRQDWKDSLAVVIETVQAETVSELGLYKTRG